MRAEHSPRALEGRAERRGEWQGCDTAVSLVTEQRAARSGSGAAFVTHRSCSRLLPSLRLSCSPQCARPAPGASSALPLISGTSPDVSSSHEEISLFPEPPPTPQTQIFSSRMTFFFFFSGFICFQKCQCPFFSCSEQSTVCEQPPPNPWLCLLALFQLHHSRCSTLIYQNTQPPLLCLQVGFESSKIHHSINTHPVLSHR